MATNDQVSYGAPIDEEGETNWAAAAAAAVVEPVAPAANGELPTREEEEDDDEWINTGADDEVENPSVGCRNKRQSLRPNWVLRVIMSDCTSNGERDSFGPVNVFIDSGMTAERLERCIIQAVSPRSSDCSRKHTSNFSDNHQYRLVGLFGNDDCIFYSLEFILEMDPLDGGKQTFCVEKPFRRMVVTEIEDISLTFSYITTGNTFMAAVIIFLAIFTVSTVAGHFDHWNHFIYSLLMLLPQDLPSMWRIISYFLDWPAREIYRYGPSIVGWEGRDLIDICTQMNRRYYSLGLGTDGHVYDDREYWRQNPEACKTIYRMKEDSFTRTCRPIWYLTVSIVSFIAIQRFICVFLAKRSGTQLKPIDYAVLDTYKALQMLAREYERQDD